MNRDDIRMLQPRDGLGFLAEALFEPGVGDDAPVEDFQRNLAPQCLVLGKKHDTHRPPAQETNDTILPESLTGFNVRH